MQRNNNVFLLGTVVGLKARKLPIDGAPTDVLDLQVQTDRVEKGGCHRVFVTGRQALELRHFLGAIQGEPLEVSVLGWLYSQPEGAVVMAGRVTAVVPKQVRQRAVNAIQHDLTLVAA